MFEIRIYTKTRSITLDDGSEFKLPPEIMVACDIHKVYVKMPVTEEMLEDRPLINSAIKTRIQEEFRKLGCECKLGSIV